MPLPEPECVTLKKAGAAHVTKSLASEDCKEPLNFGVSAQGT